MGSKALLSAILAVTASSLAFAQEPAPVAAVKQPVMQARDVYEKGGVYVGRAVTLDLANDGSGYQYFYSRLVSQRHTDPEPVVTTVESWTDPKNGPVKAIYSVQSGSTSSETIFEFSEGVVIVTKRTPRSTQKKTIKLPADTKVVLSQFNPYDSLPGNEMVAALTIYDPDHAAGLKHSVELLAKEADRTSDGERIYRVSSAAGWSEIRTDSNGRFQSMRNSKGQAMKVVNLTRDEADFLVALQAALSRAK